MNSLTLLDQPLTELGLFPPRLLNILVRAGIVTLRLLMMHTRPLLLDLNNMGDKGIQEIEATLARFGLSLTVTASEEEVVLMRALAAAYYKHALPYDVASLSYETHRKSKGYRWTKTEIVEAARRHPHIEEITPGTFQFQFGQVALVSDTTSGSASLPDLLDDVLSTERPVSVSTPPDNESADTLPDVYQLWMGVVGGLEKRKLDVLMYRFGMYDNDPLTLEETGERLGVTRERVRQIERYALDFVKRSTLKAARDRLYALVHRALHEANGVLPIASWETWLDEHTVWSSEESRPFLLRFLATLFDEVSLLEHYGVLVAGIADEDDIATLQQEVKRLLKHADEHGLDISTIAEDVAPSLPKRLQDTTTLPFLAAVLLRFEHVELTSDGRYVYVRRSTVKRFEWDSLDWTGPEESRLQRWEMKLRSAFGGVAWIGQLPLAEHDFRDLCDAIAVEAQSPGYHTAEMEGNPRLVPAAVFVTTMVLSARYTEQTPDESIDQFWSPYLRQVWNRPYSQAFMLRCAKRFRQIAPYLESEYGFAFPRHNAGDVVTPVFRHALIPRYMQTDFALWVCKNWHHILEIGQTPDLLALQLQTDRSLEHYYSQRLKQFVQSKTTAGAAAALTGNLAAAISLYLNDEQSAESISDLLADTPIEQSLWHEIARQLTATADAESGAWRSSTPRVTWVWSLEQNEMVLRVQNLVLAATSDIQGEPETLVWLERPDSNPYNATVEVNVSAWHLKTGERLIPELVLPCPNHGPAGVLVLLTDLDEDAITLPVPPPPAAPVQFFRRAQQGAYGIPVATAQVGDGTWLVLSEHPMTFTDADGDVLEPDALLAVPYPLNHTYRYAVQTTLNLPATIHVGGGTVRLTPPSTVAAVGLPTLQGAGAVPGLSLQVQPIFADTDISLVVDAGGERLLKQATLWLQGQGGLRQSWALSALHRDGLVVLEGDVLRVALQALLPDTMDLYSVQLRLSLQPVFEAPLAFAVVPGIGIDPPVPGLYTPAHPPQVAVRGVPETWVARQAGMVVEPQIDESLRVMWTDLRHDPHLLLQAGSLDISLMWTVERFMVWLEPAPTHAFLTLDELRAATLCATAQSTSFTHFQVEVSGSGSREYSLKRGHVQEPVGRSPLYDAVRLIRQPRVTLTVKLGAQTWPLGEVRRRPVLQQPTVHYGAASRTLSFRSGLSQPWPGRVRFLVESLTNPFAPPVAVGTSTQLNASHSLAVTLSEGVYVLRVELDGVPLVLEIPDARFVVGTTFGDDQQTHDLIEAIRGGHVIAPALAEEFVLLWADLAEKGEATLTPSLRYQLATVPASVLTQFAEVHLRTLWSPLVPLRQACLTTEKTDPRPYLPAWLFGDTALLLKTVRHGRLLRLFPVGLRAGGTAGYGYGFWTLSRAEEAEEEQVYVEWEPLSALEVRVRAGLPDRNISDWTALELEDTYELYFCVNCGALVGARTQGLPEGLRMAHLHGKDKADVRPLNYGNFALAAEVQEDRRGVPLRQAYGEHGVRLPYMDHLEEPMVPESRLTLDETVPLPMRALVRALKRSGLEHRIPYWVPLARLLAGAEETGAITTRGLVALAFGGLLRSAAYAPHAYRRLLKAASLSQEDVPSWLTLWNDAAPAHLAWGLWWAERLYQYGMEQARSR